MVPAELGEALDFERDGAILLRGAFPAEALKALGQMADGGKPGQRLLHPDLPALIAPATRVAATLIGPDAQPVRTVLFDKTARANWALGWHQDRTILVEERRETTGFGPWSRKHGALHVSPPVTVLQAMATLRIHIDPCGPANAPLKVALGSHRLGLVPAAKAAERALQHPILDCVAQPGDIWASRTLILHASGLANAPARRRVLQVDYAAAPLPGGLTWRGVSA